MNKRGSEHFRSCNLQTVHLVVSHLIFRQPFQQTHKYLNTSACILIESGPILKFPQKRTSSRHTPSFLRLHMS